MSQSEQPDPIFFTYSWFMFLRCTYIYILSTYSCDPVIGLMTFVPHPLKRVVRIEGDVCSSSSSSTFSRSFLPLLSELLSPTYPTDPAPVSLGLPPPVAPPSFRQIQPQALWDSLWSSPHIPDRFSPSVPSHGGGSSKQTNLSCANYSANVFTLSLGKIFVYTCRRAQHMVARPWAFYWLGHT